MAKSCNQLYEVLFQKSKLNHLIAIWNSSYVSKKTELEERKVWRLETRKCEGQEKSPPNRFIHNIDYNQSVLQHGVYKCNLCDHGNQLFQTEMDVVQHLTKNHGIAASKQSEYISKVFECRFSCGSIFRQIGVRNKHEKRVHFAKDSFCCSFCSKTFGSKYVLDAHIRDHTGEKLKCATCEKTFLYPHSLKEHERCCEFGPGANQRFSCDLCAKGQFNSESSINKCRKFLFKSKKLLRQHIRMVHDN